MTEKDLKTNKIFTYSNEDYQISIGKKDVKFAEVSFSKAISKFTIWFNNDLIFTNKKFEELENKLNKLKSHWHLELIN